MVNGPAPFSVSTSPAALTAATRVDRAGLLEAAVAAGSWAMPEKLPLPSLGTAAQPGPKLVEVRPAACAAAWVVEDLADASVLAVLESLLQAAAVRARAATMPR